MLLSLCGQNHAILYAQCYVCIMRCAQCEVYSGQLNAKDKQEKAYIRYGNRAFKVAKRMKKIIYKGQHTKTAVDMKAGQSSERHQYQFKYWIYSAQLECWNLAFFSRSLCRTMTIRSSCAYMMFLRLLKFKENKTELFKRFLDCFTTVSLCYFFFQSLSGIFFFILRCFDAKKLSSSAYIKFVDIHKWMFAFGQKSNIVPPKDKNTSDDIWWNVSKRHLEHNQLKCMKCKK